MLRRPRPEEFERGAIRFAPPPPTVDLIQQLEEEAEMRLAIMTVNTMILEEANAQSPWALY